MITYKLLIEYDGTNLHGWQVQDGHDTVQGLIESAMQILQKGKIDVVGSGRTDAGVHARGQVAHFCLTDEADPWKLRASLNGLLPREVRILDVSKAPADFHARYDAVLRTYHYFVTTEPRAIDRTTRWRVKPAPDFDAMNEAASMLLGEHDFSSFCRTKSETKNRICRVDGAEWIAERRRGDWRFAISANRFLHGMVRTIVGTLVDVGHGKCDTDAVREILTACDRRRAGQAAPARGLVLEQVTYAGSDG